MVLLLVIFLICLNIAISTISAGMVSYQIFLKCDLSLINVKVSSISNLDKLCLVGWFLALQRRERTHLIW